jgi:hypothetical protein
MNKHCFLTLICAVALCAGAARADGTQSFTGTLASPDNATSTFDSTDSFIQTITLTATSDVTLQTYGFGGGVNAAGTTIDPGGFDPFVGLFSGTGNGAVFINGTSVILANYTSGCPPANINPGFGACGDVAMTFDDLAAGTYTVLLSDGQFFAAGPTLGDGAFDLTSGFCDNLVDPGPGPSCNGNWALDVTTNSVTAPEPASLALLGMGLAAFAGLRKRRLSRRGLQE